MIIIARTVVWNFCSSYACATRSSPAWGWVCTWVTVGGQFVHRCHDGVSACSALGWGTLRTRPLEYDRSYSVCPVRTCVFPETVSWKVLDVCTAYFHQTYCTDACRDRDERVGFWGQKVSRSGWYYWKLSQYNFHSKKRNHTASIWVLDRQIYNDVPVVKIPHILIIQLISTPEAKNYK